MLIELDQGVTEVGDVGIFGRADPVWVDGDVDSSLVAGFEDAVWVTFDLVQFFEPLFTGKAYAPIDGDFALVVVEPRGCDADTFAVEEERLDEFPGAIGDWLGQVLLLEIVFDGLELRRRCRGVIRACPLLSSRARVHAPSWLTRLN